VSVVERLPHGRKLWSEAGLSYQWSFGDGAVTLRPAGLVTFPDIAVLTGVRSRCALCRDVRLGLD